MNTPKAIRITTGEQEKVQPIVDNFFLGVKTELTRTYSGKALEFEIVSENLGNRDDRATLLRCQGHYVASVIETRNDSNQVEYIFNKDFSLLQNF